MCFTGFRRAIYSLIVVSLLSCSFQAIAAEPNSTVIKGKVVDDKSGERLVGATISLSINSKLISTKSGLDGTYIIKKIPVGKYLIKIQYVGYDELTLSVNVKDGESVIARRAIQTNTFELFSSLERNFSKSLKTFKGLCSD